MFSAREISAASTVRMKQGTTQSAGSLPAAGDHLMDPVAIRRCDDKVLLKTMGGDARPELRLRRLGRRRLAHVARRFDELVEGDVLDEVRTVHREILAATGRQEPLSCLPNPSRSSRWSSPSPRLRRCPPVCEVARPKPIHGSPPRDGIAQRLAAHVLQRPDHIVDGAVLGPLELAVELLLGRRPGLRRWRRARARREPDQADEAYDLGHISRPLPAGPSSGAQIARTTVSLMIQSPLCGRPATTRRLNSW